MRLRAATAAELNIEWDECCDASDVLADEYELQLQSTQLGVTPAWEWRTVHRGGAEARLRALQPATTYRLQARGFWLNEPGPWSTVHHFSTMPPAPASKVPIVFGGAPFTPGLFVHLGTNELGHVNPATLGHAQVSCSNHARGDLNLVVGCSEGVNCTANEKGSWLAVSLSDKHWMQVDHYSLRNDDDFLRPLRNWVFEASQDGVVWTTLLEHIDDDSLVEEAGSVAAWQLPADTCIAPFCHFRIRGTGPNAHGGHTVCLAGMELYGMLWCYD